MEYTSVTNPVWANAENNVISCIVDFVDVGTVPFSANPLDTSNPSSITIYDRCVAGDFGVISMYIPAPPLTVEQNRALLKPLSAWQVRKVLTQLGLRDSVETAVANADAETKDAWHYASSFQRDDALLVSMAAAINISDAQLDAMFEAGALL